MVIGDLILNRPSAYAKVYDPARASSLIKPSSLAVSMGNKAGICEMFNDTYHLLHPEHRPAGTLFNSEQVAV
jgi:hypothetical protein